MTQNGKVDVPAIIFQARLVDGFDPDDPKTMAERSVIFEPLPHPTIAAALDAAGATKLGRYTWTFGTDEHPRMTPFAELLRLIKPRQVIPASRAVTRGGKPTNLRSGYRSYIYGHEWGFAGLNPLAKANADQLLASYQGSKLQGYVSTDYKDTHGMFSINCNGKSVYMSAITMFTDDVVERAVEYAQIDERLVVRTNLRQPGRSPWEARPAYPAQVWQTAETLKVHGAEVVYTPEVEKVMAKLETSMVAYPAPGRPAEIAVVVGPQAFDENSHQGQLLGDLVDHLWDNTVVPAKAYWSAPTPRRMGMGVRSISAVQRTLERLGKRETDKVYLHPKTEDLNRLAGATPVVDPRLRDYQQIGVGMHLATNYGFVSALEPGMGKTIVALDAMRRRAKTIEKYRGLVVVEANVRSQWAGEAEIWFPEAEMVCVYGVSDTEKLQTALQSDGSVLVITSYSVAGKVAKLVEAEAQAAAEAKEAAKEAAKIENLRKAGQADEAAKAAVEKAKAATHAKLEELLSTKAETSEEGEQGVMFTLDGEPHPLAALDTEVDTGKLEVEANASIAEMFADTHWHDLIADEAAVLRNPGTSQAKAMWRIRENSDVAVALTGTPITRNGIDDLGRLIAWVRNDPQMFTGAKLSSTFDVADDDDLVAFQEAVGPLVLRRNKADISEELPEMTAEVIMLEPSEEELDLARAAREELKRVYFELVALMEMAEEANPDDPRIDEVRDALRAARGAWLGGTQLARMAAADPAALIGSDSAGAELLAGSGLIEAANKVRGTKRRWAIDLCLTRVAEGKQVIIFTEFATVARGLIADLEERDIRVGGILGGGGKQRDRNVDEFRDGNLDVLVATSSGKRGLNLQTATTVVHYDLPWTPDDVAQRTARVERIGATAEEVEVLFPISTGTIEERIVALLTARAATAVRALDISRGADGATTDMGRILVGLMPAVDTSHLDEGQMSMLEITRALVT